MDPTGVKIVHVQHPETYYPQDPQASSLKLDLGIPMAKYHEDEYFSAFALSQTIGNGFSSRILDKIRHEKGLVYSIQSRHVTEPYSTRMEIMGKIPSGRQNEVIGMIFDEFDKLKTIPVSQEEAEKFFNKREYSMTKGYNYPETIINHIASNIENNATTDYDIERLKLVTPQSIMEAARKYLPTSQNDGNYVMLKRDPLKDLGDLDKEPPMEFIS
jgi:predicted Zn-dependent peptidase